VPPPSAGGTPSTWETDLFPLFKAPTKFSCRMGSLPPFLMRRLAASRAPSFLKTSGFIFRRTMGDLFFFLFFFFLVNLSGAFPFGRMSRLLQPRPRTLSFFSPLASSQFASPARCNIRAFAKNPARCFFFLVYEHLAVPHFLTRLKACFSFPLLLIRMDRLFSSGPPPSDRGVTSSFPFPSLVKSTASPLAIEAFSLLDRHR